LSWPLTQALISILTVLGVRGVDVCAQANRPERCRALTSVHLNLVVRPFLIQEPNMLHYAVVFFVIALIAALFGFGGIAAGAVSIGKLLFIVFIVLAVASFLYGLIKGR
jgi:uncharacterized membrane protein YtjA (UPF0391 family)